MHLAEVRGKIQAAAQQFKGIAADLPRLPASAQLVSRLHAKRAIGEWGANRGKVSLQALWLPAGGGQRRGRMTASRDLSLPRGQYPEPATEATVNARFTDSRHHQASFVRPFAGA